MNLMLLSTTTASNEADWCKVRMRLQRIAGMGLHKIGSVMNGTTLVLPTKLKSKISAWAKRGGGSNINSDKEKRFFFEPPRPGPDGQKNQAGTGI